MYLLAWDVAAFGVSQGRLGPGRLHHCMRLIGAGERALELMASRAQGRVAFGKPLAANGAVLQTLAECRVHWEGARLLLLHAALQLDSLGNKAARIAIAVAKVSPLQGCTMHHGAQLGPMVCDLQLEVT